MFPDTGTTLRLIQEAQMLPELILYGDHLFGSTHLSSLVHSGQIPTVISMLLMSGKKMVLKCTMYLIRRSRISKMAAAKPELHVSQFQTRWPNDSNGRKFSATGK